MAVGVLCMFCSAVALPEPIEWQRYHGVSASPDLRARISGMAIDHEAPGSSVGSGPALGSFFRTT
jgi:hypothetical protein